MCILQIRRWCAVLLLPIGLSACGYDAAELIPPGLRATLAAEDRAKQSGPGEKPVSVDEMLSRVRTGGKGAPPATDSAASRPAEAPAANVAAATPPVTANPNVPDRTGGAAPAAGGAHPLWSQMMATRQGQVPTAAQPAPQAALQSAPPFAVQPAPQVAAKPAPPPVDARTVVLRFPGKETDLSTAERQRLDAAVALHKVNSGSARVVAGPSNGQSPFDQLLIAERRSRSIEGALPTDFQHSRTFSPEIDDNTVRVEFQAKQQ